MPIKPEIEVKTETAQQINKILEKKTTLDQSPRSFSETVAAIEEANKQLIRTHEKRLGIFHKILQLFKKLTLRFER